jgi:hypothetical protein
MAADLGELVHTAHPGRLAGGYALSDGTCGESDLPELGLREGRDEGAALGSVFSFRRQLAFRICTSKLNGTNFRRFPWPSRIR